MLYKKKTCIKKGSDLTLCIENVAKLSDRYSDWTRIGFFLTDWTKHQGRIFLFVLQIRVIEMYH